MSARVFCAASRVVMQRESVLLITFDRCIVAIKMRNNL
jgi:hypothetical protein